MHNYVKVIHRLGGYIDVAVAVVDGGAVIADASDDVF